MGTSKLQQDISAVTTDTEFLATCHNMGLYTLADILKQGSAQIRQHPQFDMLWYAELLSLLDEQGLLDAYEKV